METVFQQLLLWVAALISNLLSALAGGGAGLLQLPVLLFLGLTFPVALATHKIASVALGIGATTRHMREGSLRWQTLLMIIAAGVPGVLLGAWWVSALKEERLAIIALGILTLGLGLYSVFSPSLGQQQQRKNDRGWRLALGLLGLFIIGLINGSLASGTGLFCTILLIRWFGFDYKLAVAYTLVAVGLVWNGSGAITLALLSEVRWDWLPALLIGAFMGGYLGAHLAIIKGNRFIKIIFEIVTIGIGIKLLIGLG